MRTHTAGRQESRTPLGKAQLLRLKSRVPEGGNFDELAAVPLDRLAELHVEELAPESSHFCQ